MRDCGGLECFYTANIVLSVDTTTIQRRSMVFTSERAWKIWDQQLVLKKRQSADAPTSKIKLGCQLLPKSYAWWSWWLCRRSACDTPPASVIMCRHVCMQKSSWRSDWTAWSSGRLPCLVLPLISSTQYWFPSACCNTSHTHRTGQTFFVNTILHHPLHYSHPSLLHHQ